MTTEKLFDEGKYMVIYIYPETVKLDERQFFLWNLEDMSTAKANTRCFLTSVLGSSSHCGADLDPGSADPQL
jgi:hypothetical protein